MGAGLSDDYPGFAAHSSVLLVDDDLGSREVVASAMKRLGFRLVAATSGSDAIALAATHDFNLLLIDLQLPDMSGMDVVRSARRNNPAASFIIVSASFTVASAVDAIRRGALDVVEKPFEIDDLVSRVSLAMRRVRKRVGAPLSSIGNRTRFTAPRSVAERWATFVAQALDAPGDLKTLRHWATFVGVSYSSLCETCRLLDIRPQAARDFSRMLKALIESERHGCPPEALLDVSDRRTIATMFERAGLARGSSSRVSLDEFLRRQQFVPAGNEALVALRTLLDRSVSEQRRLRLG